MTRGPDCRRHRRCRRRAAAARVTDIQKVITEGVRSVRHRSRLPDRRSVAARSLSGSPTLAWLRTNVRSGFLTPARSTRALTSRPPPRLRSRPRGLVTVELDTPRARSTSPAERPGSAAISPPPVRRNANSGGEEAEQPQVHREGAGRDRRRIRLPARQYGAGRHRAIGARPAAPPEARAAWHADRSRRVRPVRSRGGLCRPTAATAGPRAARPEEEPVSPGRGCGSGDGEDEVTVPTPPGPRTRSREGRPGGRDRGGPDQIRGGDNPDKPSPPSPRW
ncbi:hypothetical protein HBB16_05865 [Pseudonocardia sp. MCCB 268]|nr:hypothetical protein [Pseudonocardia cytotoxica]